MHAFTDLAGRTWEVRVDVYRVRLVKGLLGIYLPSLVEKKCAGLGALVGDLERFVDVLWVLCRDQAEKGKIDQDSFSEGLGGDELRAAVDAFIDELTDFFPDPEVRKNLGMVIGKGRRVRDLMLSQSTNEIQAALAKLTDEQAATGVWATMKRDDEAERKKQSETSGNTPASSA